MPHITLHIVSLDVVEGAGDESWFVRVAELTLAAAGQGAADGSSASPPTCPSAPPGKAPAVPPGSATAIPPRPELEAALLLADDATLQRLNRDFRGVDCPTDVLSFAQLEGSDVPAPPPGLPQHLGDVAISVERVRRQAAEYGHSYERELGYLFVHGLLHLLGYDHEGEDQRAVMREVEEAALSAAGLLREAA